MKPTNPKLWEAAKKNARTTSEGTPPGRWGARRAAIARLDYERLGGKWVKGPAPPRPEAKKGDTA